MLDYTSSLHTLAQIGAAFAGFASLAAAIGASSGVSMVAFARLRGVVLNGFVLAVGAMFPILVQGFGATDVLVWRISAGLLLFFNWTTIYVGTRFYNAEKAIPVLDKSLVIPLEVIIHTILLVVIFGLFSSYSAVLVLTYLVFVLAQAIIMFLGFFELVFSPDE